MSIKLGNSNITLKVGSSPVTAAYLGSTQVYPQGEPPTPPTPTSYTYSVTITGLENGDTTTIWWDATRDIHTDSNVGNGTYTYTTTADDIAVNLDISGLSDYTVDHDQFMLYSGGSQTVTFTHQGGGGLVQIPYGANMSHYYGQSIARIVINDTTTTQNTYVTCQHTNEYGQLIQDTLTIGQWAVWGTGQFQSVNGLPIDVTVTTPVELVTWSQGFGSSDTINYFNDLQIEWA